MELNEIKPKQGGKIIYLNGSSSVGKTTLARALQKSLPEPYLLLGIDLFISMLPERYWNDDPAGFTLVPTEAGLEIKTGPVAAKMSQALQETIVTLARNGNNLIVDDVNWDQAALEAVKKRLAPFDYLLVKVECPVEVAEQRECQRGDREIGFVKFQHARVKATHGYDLTVNTAASSPQECALQIISKMQISFVEPPES